ncbi:hypothetical protein LCGC14_0232340 [marine sediment metagenome]|uniref:Uncharacterized protein n=1 Tax=marine sediment metagenome TaxID=412755 RepID=A0A0F9XEB7_9ZZZZ
MLWTLIPDNIARRYSRHIHSSEKTDDVRRPNIKEMAFCEDYKYLRFGGVVRECPWIHRSTEHTVGKHNQIRG